MPTGQGGNENEAGKNTQSEEHERDYREFSGDQKEFDKIWDAFYLMVCIGFIEKETWKKFFDQCAGWYIDEENACVRDGRNCPNGVDSIVWEYTPYEEYTSSK